MRIYCRGFCDMLIEHMKKGHSFKTFSASIQYPEELVNSWLITKPDFAQAKAIGEIARLQTLETLLLSKMISLDVFQHLTKQIESDVDVDSFDDNVLIQAKERFAK